MTRNRGRGEWFGCIAPLWRGGRCEEEAILGVSTIENIRILLNLRVRGLWICAMQGYCQFLYWYLGRVGLIEMEFGENLVHVRRLKKQDCPFLSLFFDFQAQIEAYEVMIQ